PPPPAVAAGRGIPDPRSPAGQALARIRMADASFDAGRFLGGAEGAFRMIVQAFASGDRNTLRDLLAPEAFAGFDQAIAAREAAGATQRTEIRAIHDMGIEEADLRGTIADITVRIVSDQVNVTTAADGSISAGAEAVTEITDLWTFQRDLAVSDPTWKLVGTRPA
ncbi:Tim44/TimA family putative adaptor protein, partial [Neoroseomonas oryzicola]